MPIDSDHQEKDEVDPTQSFDQTPGAFPKSDQTEQLCQRKPVTVVSKDECEQSRPIMAEQSPAVDTSSFAAAILRRGRKREPLDVALAGMQCGQALELVLIHWRDSRCLSSTGFLSL